MSKTLLAGILLILTPPLAKAADFTPAPQQFQQEVARHFVGSNGAPGGAVQLIECLPDGAIRAFASGSWYEFRQDRWTRQEALLESDPNQFVFSGRQQQPLRAPVPWREVRQLVRGPSSNWVVTSHRCLAVSEEGKVVPLPWAADRQIQQMALSPAGIPHAASSDGLFTLHENAWERIDVRDGLGRAWAAGDVLGVAFD